MQENPVKPQHVRKQRLARPQLLYEKAGMPEKMMCFDTVILLLGFYYKKSSHNWVGIFVQGCSPELYG